MYTQNDFRLYHHGIKGQKWGVRRFQNSDGSLTPAGRERYGYGPAPNERTVLKKGTRVSSVSYLTNSEAYKNKGLMYTYNPNDEWDRSVYNGPFALYKAMSSGYQFLANEHSYEVVRDLKMPTSSERFDEFVKLYENNTRLFRKELGVVQKQMEKMNMGPANKAAQKVDFKNIKTDEDLVAMYKIFNHAMETAQSFKSTKMYLDAMQTKYDAMVDDNNQGVYNEAHDPVIIFRTNLVLKTAAPVKMGDLDNVMENYKHVQAELGKKGKMVAL